MATERPLILSLAGDAVAAGDDLGGLSEADRRIFLRQLWIDHAPAQRAVVHRLGAAREFPVRFLQDVRGARHALDAAGEKAGAISGLDLARCRDHRLHARAAE